MADSDLARLIPLLIPLILLELGLMIAALIDLLRRERRTKGPKWVWGSVIVLFSIIGPLVYFFLGREES
jgi:hypothetical protein